MKSETANTEVLLFLRSPVEGQVKTRLARLLGDGTTLELYKRFVVDILDTLRLSGQPVRILFHPKRHCERVRQWLGPDAVLTPQKGADLGQRMENAFRSAFGAGTPRALLLGTDFPDLPLSVIREAVNALETAETVLGPAADGGYYLIGFRADTFSPAVFSDIGWGSERVYDQTRLKLSGLRRSIHTLPRWHDIDRWDDLVAFVRRNLAGPLSGAPRTMAFLSTLTVDLHPERSGDGDLLQSRGSAKI